MAALILGRLFDRLGMPVIMAVSILSAFFAPLVFLGGFNLALLGMVLWGIGMGAQESIIKAALAEMVPRDRRATGYGIFNAGFGLFWFLGSALMGILYDFSLGALVAFSVTIQLLAIPFFLRGLQAESVSDPGDRRCQANRGEAAGTRTGTPPTS